MHQFTWLFVHYETKSRNKLPTSSNNANNCMWIEQVLKAQNVYLHKNLSQIFFQSQYIIAMIIIDYTCRILILIHVKTILIINHLIEHFQFKHVYTIPRNPPKSSWSMNQCNVKRYESIDQTSQNWLIADRSIAVTQLISGSSLHSRNRNWTHPMPLNKSSQT